jgi:hypothetical protein
MSNGKPSMRQTQRSLSERVAGLEQNLAQILFNLNRTFQQANQRIGTVEELVDALVNLQGSQDVQDYVNAKRIERAEALAAQEKASLEAGVAEGFVIPAETASEKSVIVGRYYGADGTVTPPGRVQLVMPGVQQEFREKLLGKPKGTILDLANSEKYELMEIYEVDEEKFKEVQTAKAAKAAEEAAKTAGETAKKDETADAAAPTDTEATPVDPEADFDRGTAAPDEAQ